MRAAANSVAISAKSMYVAPKQASKHLAGTAASNPRRIIRKLRLALLQRSCRLPLGARQTRRQRKTSTFSRGDCKLSGLGGIRGIGVSPRGYTRSSIPKPAISEQFEIPVRPRRQTLRIIRGASDQTDWTCVLYLGCRPLSTASRGQSGSTDGNFLARSSFHAG
jgi:hypothetical protein